MEGVFIFCQSLMYRKVRFEQHLSPVADRLDRLKRCGVFVVNSNTLFQHHVCPGVFPTCCEHMRGAAQAGWIGVAKSHQSCFLQEGLPEKRFTKKNTI